MLKKLFLIGFAFILILGVAAVGLVMILPEPELEATEFTFDQADAQYGANDDVVMELTVENFEADDEQSIGYSMQMTVKDPDGNAYAGLEEEVVIPQKSEEIGSDWGIVDFTATANPPSEGWKSGENVVVIEVVDHVANEPVEITKTFEVA